MSMTASESGADHRFCGPRPFLARQVDQIRARGSDAILNAVRDQTPTFLLLLGAHTGINEPARKPRPASSPPPIDHRRLSPAAAPEALNLAESRGVVGFSLDRLNAPGGEPGGAIAVGVINYIES